MIGFSISPIPSISIRTTSPAFSSAGGFMPMPTPEGVPVAIIGRIADAELAFRVLRSIREPRLRPVAVVDRTYVGNQGRLRGYPILGGPDGIQQAVQDLGVNAVVVLDRRRSGSVKNDALNEYLATTGSLDVYVLRISLEPASAGTEVSRS